MQFNDEPEFRSGPRRRKQSWPTKLAFKLGAKNEAQANLFMVIVSVIFIGITIYMYTQIIFPSPTDPDINIEDFPPEVRQQLEAQGVI